MIHCSFCNTENRADAIYCNTCGGLLQPGAAPPRAYRGPTTLPVHATGQLPSQSLVAGHYLILRVIGEGGMAAVYQATDTATGRAVAIKEMSQDGLGPDETREALDSFKFEADTLMRLRHPNLPQVYEHFFEGSRHFLVMDFIDGQTLEQRLHANGSPLSENEVLRIADQLCDVLGYLHGRKPPIIFRDLKPGNIMVTTDGRVKLIDFGIARFFTPGRMRDTQALGTPGYAPPEQYGKAQTDPRADIYALGATLYHLLTAYDPATTPFSLPPISSRVSGVSPGLQRIVEKATQLDREKRYRSVAELQVDLRTVTAGLTAAPRVPMMAGAAQAPQPAGPIPGNASISRLAVKPASLMFGQLMLRQRAKQNLVVEGLNPRADKLVVTALAPWLKVNLPRAHSSTAIVEVTVDTAGMLRPGLQQANVQIASGRQVVLVPVTAELVPASSAKGATPTWPGVAPRRAPVAPRHAPQPMPYQTNPYQVPGFIPPKKFSVLRLAISWALALGMSAAALYFVPAAFDHVGAGAPMGWLMTTLLLCASAIGAVIGQTASPWLGRGRASFLFGLMGLFVSLLVPPLGLPSTIGGDQVIGPLLMATGAALGAEYAVGHSALAGFQFIFRRARWMITVAAMIFGGFLGLKVGGQYFGWVLLFFGVFFGWLFSIITNGVLGRISRTSP
ncbi:MAG TPA: protein kinase [Ktedonobacterales bacterium]